MSDLQTRDFKVAPTPEADGTEDAPRTVRGLAVPVSYTHLRAHET